MDDQYLFRASDPREIFDADLLRGLLPGPYAVDLARLAALEKALETLAAAYGLPPQNGGRT